MGGCRVVARGVMNDRTIHISSSYRILGSTKGGYDVCAQVGARCLPPHVQSQNHPSTMHYGFVDSGISPHRLDINCISRRSFPPQ